MNVNSLVNMDLVARSKLYIMVDIDAYTSCTVRQFIQMLHIRSAKDWAQIINIITNDKVSIRSADIISRIYLSGFDTVGTFRSKHFLLMMIEELEDVDNLNFRLKQMIKMAGHPLSDIIKNIYEKGMTIEDSAKSVNITKYEHGQIIDVFYLSIAKSTYRNYLFAGEKVSNRCDKLLMADNKIPIKYYKMLALMGIADKSQLDEKFSDCKDDEACLNALIALNKRRNSHLNDLLINLNRFNYISIEETKLKFEIECDDKLGASDIRLLDYALDLSMKNPEYRIHSIQEIYTDESNKYKYKIVMRKK